jgi:GNAT superfamily N-acetyltransferase
VTTQTTKTSPGDVSADVEIRRGTPADTRACFEVFLESAVDLTRRIGTPWDADPNDVWAKFEPIFRRLEDIPDWWVAEAERGGLIGYARSVARDGLFELTEFFVRPGRQSAGVGRRLLELAFPADRGEVRAIIATVDLRALSRYYAAGTVARFPIVSMTAPPMADEQIALEAVRAGSGDIPTLAGIERQVLEFDRGTDELAWLLEQREGYLYRRDRKFIGLGFIGPSGTGPIAALDPADQAAILVHLEARAKALGRSEVSFEVPMINEVAMRHLLSRRYRMDAFLTLLLSSRPFGQFDRFMGFSPPFFL